MSFSDYAANAPADQGSQEASIPSRRRESSLRTYVITHIDEAVERGWAKPFYQPVVRALTGKLCGFEALARWDDPTYGLLSPAEFIPALEDAEVIHLLDCSIIRQVCQNYRERVNKGEPIVPTSLNLSRLDFELCDIFEVIEQAVREYEVPRRMLNIEITESVLGSDPEYFTSMLRKFREAGYQVWMDDFGSGYSTLNVLKDFDFNELKIDMEFLSHFDERSKAILASVVNMAKRLGIQTLAEGVETEEHSEYLRLIGCEKMQGYLFGRPEPYSSERLRELCEKMGVETTSERLYVNELGAVNTLSLSERDFTAGNSTQGYVTSMPLALVEYSDGLFSILKTNRVFQEALANIGLSTIEETVDRINDKSRTFARQAHKVAEAIEVEKYARIDFVTGGTACVVRLKHISSRDGKTAMLASIDDTIAQSERRRHDRMNDMLSVIYSIYEHVDIIHLDERYIEPVFSGSGIRTQIEAPDFGSVTRYFADKEVYPLDRDRYTQFMDHDTMIQRIKDSGENFLTASFRLRQSGGNYAWKMFGLIWLEDEPGELVMLYIRNAHWTHEDMLHAIFDGASDEEFHKQGEKEATLTDGSLWRGLLSDSRARVFWKDENRRFAGANRAFLDYYGFDSLDCILGKTDEDMGWHIDPKPFQSDELRVLGEGVSVENSAGHCIVDGEVRSIVASKHPVYHNGRITGLVGYFMDVEERVGEEGELSSLPLRDKVTNVLNYTGLEAATWQYVDAYRRQGIDFAMISINIESFGSINSSFGYEFGDKVLRRIGDELTDIAGHNCVVGHVFADRFVVLAQGDSDEELQAICDEIENRMMAITQIDGTSCTVFALAGYARFSEMGDVEAMKRHNRDRRMERRAKLGKVPGGEDVITSTLL